ncbi:activator-dependent family glycosyltransferase [Thermocatellispora tengchongensis]|uniref:activator-dependent family glycosyltransferase n=1 Tax=Thermocatellispora tengchongensis TaxID=1073253 RepID=UPI00362BBF6B
MRVLFLALPARTHLYSMVPLAWSLHAAGHQVCVASAPDLTAEITRTGLTPVAIGETADIDAKARRRTRSEVTNAWTAMAESRPEMLTWDFVLPVLAYSARVMQELNTPRAIDDLVAFAREWRPDLVVWDPLTMAGPIAARVTGAAHARMLWGMDLLGRMRRIFLDIAAHPLSEFTEDPLGEWLRRALKAYDRDFDEEVVAGQWTIDPWPSWLGFPLGLRRVAARYVPYNGPVPIPRWVLRPPERPRVCLTLGLSQREVEGEHEGALPAMLEALGGLDVEVVATLNAAQLAAVPALPGNVRPVDFVPLSTLLPACSLIIHHGGSGTFGNALVAGVPQFVVPDGTWDSTLIGARLAERGAGLSAGPDERTPRPCANRCAA